MVRLNVRLGADSSESVENLLEALRFLIAAPRLEPGSLGCSAWTESDSTVHYLEDWETEADMRRRVRSPRFTSLLSVIESADHQPHVQFDFIATTRAIDYVAEIRAATSHASGD
jgi:quinol monooxygenase YgiN